MSKTVQMSLSLTMDRMINKKIHYISPGGYELRFENGESIAFDFNEYAGTVDGYSIHCDLSKLDTDSFPNAKRLADTLLTSKVSEIVECYVYTGEDDGNAQINPLGINHMSFEIFDGDNDTWSEVKIGEDILSAYKIA